jgi:hypothetical protein
MNLHSLKLRFYHSYSVDDIRYQVNEEAQVDDEIDMYDDDNNYKEPKGTESNQMTKANSKIDTPIREVALEKEDTEEKKQETGDQILVKESSEEHPKELVIENKMQHIKNIGRAQTLGKGLLLKHCPESTYNLATVFKRIADDNRVGVVKQDQKQSRVKEMKSFSITRLHKLGPAINKERMFIKELALAKEDIVNKAACIEELTDENLKLYTELEELRQKLEEIKKAGNDLNQEGKLNHLESQHTSDLEPTTPSHRELIRIPIIPSPTNQEKKQAKPKATKAQCPPSSVAKSLIDEFLRSYANNKKQFMKDLSPIKVLLKTITTVYMNIFNKNKEHLNKPNNVFALKNPLSMHFYEILLNRYGNKAFAKKKLISLLAAGLAHQKIPRIHIFIGLMGLTNDLEEEDANFYIRSVGYMQQLKMGVNIKNSDTAEKHYIPYVRALEACKLYFQASLPKEMYTEFIKKLEKYKEVDKTKLNSNGIIEIDTCLLHMLEEYHILIGKIRDYVFDIFKASDLDGSNTIDFFEFYVIFRNIEPSKYSFEKCRSIFNNSCEYHSGKQNMIPVVTFNQFAAICHAQNLFSENSQNAFLGYAKTDELIKLVGALNTKYADISSTFVLRLDDLMSKSEYLNNILKTLKQTSSRGNTAREAKGVWMMYRFIEMLSKELYKERLAQNALGEFDVLVIEDEPSAIQLLMSKENGSSVYVEENSQIDIL